MNLKEIFIEKYRNNKELSKSFTWRLIQVVTKQGTTALMFFIATFFLPKVEMGLYNYISSVILLLVIFSDFGISISTSRYVALYNVKSKEYVKKIFFNSFAIVFVVSLLIVLIVYVFKDRLFPNHFEYIQVVLPMLLIAPLTSILDGMYRGLKRFKSLAIVSVLNTFVGIAASFFLVPSFGLKGVIWAQIIYLGVYSFVLLVLHREYIFKLEKKILADVGKYAISFGVATLGFYFFSKVNILILGMFNLMEEIAVYELLNKIFTLSLVPFSVLGQVLAPNIVEMFAEKQYLKILNIFKRFLKYLLILDVLYIPFSMIFISVGVEYLFPQYSNGIMHSILLPVALTYAVALPITVLNTGILTSTGHAKIMAIQNVISGLVNVAGILLVIDRYGYVGVVWLTFSIQLLSTIVLYMVYVRKLKEKNI